LLIVNCAFQKTDRLLAAAYGRYFSPDGQVFESKEAALDYACRQAQSDKGEGAVQGRSAAASAAQGGLRHTGGGAASGHQVICKAGRYTCPLCGLQFRLNQAYGGHVRAKECRVRFKYTES
jgi:hypothetical protein